VSKPERRAEFFREMKRKAVRTEIMDRRYDRYMPAIYFSAFPRGMASHRMKESA